MWKVNIFSRWTTTKRNAQLLIYFVIAYFSSHHRTLMLLLHFGLVCVSLSLFSHTECRCTIPFVFIFWYFYCCLYLFSHVTGWPLSAVSWNELSFFLYVWTQFVNGVNVRYEQRQLFAIISSQQRKLKYRPTWCAFVSIFISAWY